jgi:RimJ/RimL family protein N-acetyltransferase
VTEFVLFTDRLRLTLDSPEETLARIERMSPAELAEVSPVWLANMKQATAPDPWLHWWSVIDRLNGEIVGSGGFKGPPDNVGIVEVAYGVDTAFQGRGYATETCRALVQFALGFQTVRVVRAHTRKENIASARVLAKCGFTCVGEVIDPEDGLVLQWQLSRPDDKPRL